MFTRAVKVGSTLVILQETSDAIVLVVEKSKGKLHDIYRELACTSEQNGKW